MLVTASIHPPNAAAPRPAPAVPSAVVDLRPQFERRRFEAAVRTRAEAGASAKGYATAAEHEAYVEGYVEAYADVTGRFRAVYASPHARNNTGLADFLATETALAGPEMHRVLALAMEGGR